MADGFRIATAYVEVKPSLDGFAEELKAKVDAATSGGKSDVRVGVNQGYLDAALAIAKAKVDALAAKGATINLGVDTKGLTAALAAISGAGATAGGAGGRMGPFWWLGGTIAGMKAWHVILDGVIEAVIAVGTAAAAAAVGIAAMAPAMGNIHDQLLSVQAVNKALGDQIPSLTTSFNQLAKAVAPQVIEAYGGALALVSHSTGAFAQVAHRVVDMFDTWIAKIDLWAQSSGIANKLLQDGVVFLGQFGQIFGHLGDALKNFIGDMPGIAHILLDVIDGVAQVVDWFSKLPGPLVTATLAIHGAYVWGRLLGTALLAAAKSAITFGKSMAALAVNPLTWVVAGAAALGYMAYQGSKADSAVQGLISSMETKLSTENASQAILQLSADIGTLQEHINSLSLKTFEEQMLHPSGFGQIVQQAGYGLDAIFARITDSMAKFAHGDVLGAAKDQFMALWDVVGGNGDAARVEFTRNMQAMNSEIDKMLGSSRNLFAETGKLMTQGFSYAQSLGVMDLAGVRWNDTAAVMQQKVTNLIDGYKAMGIQGGLLANSVNAITFATLQQDSKVGQLTQAWSTFFNTLTGGESGFVGFAQQAQGLFKAIAQGGATLRDSSGHISSSISSLTGAASSTKNSLTGLSATSLTLRSTFVQAAQAAQQQLNSLTMLASAAGLGAKGTQMLTQATQDMVARLLPAARGSQALTTVLYGLAQQGGYQGADSFKALATWVGNVQNPMHNLDKITTTLTVDAGNLATDVKNLSDALGQTLTGAMKSAIFFADGGQKAFNDFATALHNTHEKSSDLQAKAVTLGNELVSLTGNTTNAHKEFDTLAIGMGQSKQQADTLWNEIVGKLDPALTGIPKNENIHIVMSGSGQYTITGSGIRRSQGPGGSGNAAGGLAAGGFVSGPGGPETDSIPAWLSDGEYVVRADSVSKYGQGFFDALNAGMYAGGGPVMTGNTAVLSGQYANTIVNAFTDSMTKSMLSAMKSAISSAKASGSGSPFMGAVPNGPVQSAARAMLNAMGWGGQWGAFNSLVMRESGWRWNATNPSSGAYGIPQALPAGKMASAGADWRTNPITQLRWMMGYISGRYGSPDNAWAHELSAGWYHRGGAVRRASGGSAEARSGSSLMNFYTTSHTVAAVMKELTTYLKDIARYYTGQARRSRERLVEAQTHHLERVDTQIGQLNAKISSARSFQSSVASGLSSYAGLSGLDAFGNLMVPGVKPGQSVGQGLESQLRLKLANLRKWQADLTALRRAKVSPALISQVAQMDPDTGMQYAEAILAGGSSLIKEMNATETQIGKVQTSTAAAAERAVYGVSVGRMRRDERELTVIARDLGRELAKEAAKWFKVPRSQQPTVVLNFHGQHPTAEEKHQLMRDLALVLG